MKFKVYSNLTFKKIPQVQTYLSPEEIFEIEIVARVFPFKVNHYVIEKLIDWKNYKQDPIYILTFPQKEMLLPEDFEILSYYVKNQKHEEITKTIHQIRKKLNPHPAGQTKNVPIWNGIPLSGIQHKYKETVLFFPKEGQTCHTYCTFCFRWPQFVSMDTHKFAMKEVELLIEYLKEHTEITDILFTGGDPMIMKSKIFQKYIDAILEANLKHIQTIRIGSKSLSYWPYRFTQESDSQELLAIFRKIVNSGIHLSFMAHFNHYQELQTPEIEEAIENILNTGALIRTQSPLIRHINDSSRVWIQLWKKQISMGMIPYYMFVERDTGAKYYFSVPLEKAWKIFKNAYQKISGLARTVKGPSMSTYWGKVRVLGVSEIFHQKYFVLDFLQAREPQLVGKPFLAKFSRQAHWIDDLEPAIFDPFSVEIFKMIDDTRLNISTTPGDSSESQSYKEEIASTSDFAFKN